MNTVIFDPAASAGNGNHVEAAGSEGEETESRETLIIFLAGAKRADTGMTDLSRDESRLGRKHQHVSFQLLFWKTSDPDRCINCLNIKWLTLITAIVCNSGNSGQQTVIYIRLL